MKKCTIVLVLIALIITSCAPTDAQIQKAIEKTQAAATTGIVKSITITPVFTNTPLLTNTPQPTSTPKATNTPAPTNTVAPTNTPTPVPQPVTFTGQGDQVIDFDNPFGAAIVKIKYTGGHNFVIWNLDKNNEHIDLLVNTVGTYSGTVPLDFSSEKNTKRFSVESSGPWEMTISPLLPEYVDLCTLPLTCHGTGDDVVVLRGGNPDIAKITYSGTHNFVVWAYSEKSGNLLVNEVGAYEGSVVVPSDAFLIVVGADSEGAWSMDITKR